MTDYHVDQYVSNTPKSDITFGLIHFSLDSDYKGQWSAHTTYDRVDVAFVGTFDEAIQSALTWAKSKNLTIKWKEPTLK